jgi:dTDP-4-dehydrorhamnose 3,5-epimerase
VIFSETPLAGAFLIVPEPIEDERGFFASAWTADELKSRSLESEIVETSMAWNARRGTLRGMHYQVEPYDHAKLVRCAAGAIYDVIIDLRQTSPTKFMTKIAGLFMCRGASPMVTSPWRTARRFSIR